MKSEICFSILVVIVIIILFLLKEKKEEPRNEVSDEDFKEAYNIHVHTDKIYHQRFNFFLVAESMLVVSYVSSLTQNFKSSDIGVGICIIGMIFTSIWFYVNARLEYRICYMIEKYLKKNQIYRDYVESVGGAYSKIFLVYTLPISMNLLWVFFLCDKFEVDFWFWLMESFLGMTAFSIWMNYILIPKHKPNL